MTKDQLIESVQKSCDGDDISKRLTGDVLDAAFQSIQKAIKKKQTLFLPRFWDLFGKKPQGKKRSKSTNWC